jgi:hypothetical protein
MDVHAPAYPPVRRALLSESCALLIALIHPRIQSADRVVWHRAHEGGPIPAGCGARRGADHPRAHSSPPHVVLVDSDQSVMQNITMPCLLFSKIVPAFTASNIAALGTWSALSVPRPRFPQLSVSILYKTGSSLKLRSARPRSSALYRHWRRTCSSRPCLLLGPAPVPERANIGRQPF